MNTWKATNSQDFC